MIHQLRIYEVFDRNKEAFHKRFRDHAWRIMRSYGFNIIGTWETSLGDRTEFVYLLVWPDEKTMRHAWEKFKADEEWKKIKKDTNARHGDLVGEIEDRMLSPTNYNPVILGIEAQNKSV
jgi:heme-degrading monooxygenase HmoA